MTIVTVSFYLLALAAIATALLVVTRRSPMMSVLFLVAHFFVLAVLYLTLNAQFIAIIQILVYAGAIMVLFLFVIMLLNLDDELRFKEKLTNRKIIAVALSLIFLVQIGMGVFAGIPEAPQALASNAREIGTVESIGAALFSNFLFPFEITSILLLAAIVGAVVLAKKQIR